jgi:hypothetical protein
MRRGVYIVIRNRKNLVFLGSLLLTAAAMRLLDEERDETRKFVSTLLGKGQGLEQVLIQQHSLAGLFENGCNQKAVTYGDTRIDDHSGRYEHDEPDYDELDEENESKRQCGGPSLYDLARYRIGIACMHVPCSIAKSAAELADPEGAIKRIRCPLDIRTAYSVRGARGIEYIVIGSRFCTCHFFRENVLKRRSGWACKHIIAVMLRVAIRGPETIREHPDGYKLILNIFGI